MLECGLVVLLSSVFVPHSVVHSRNQSQVSESHSRLSRDSDGISKLTEIQLILPYKVSCIRCSLEIPLLSLLKIETLSPGLQGKMPAGDIFMCSWPGSVFN